MIHSFSGNADVTMKYEMRFVRRGDCELALNHPRENDLRKFSDG
jgi:hypothetical protein